jgi:hypothetical protein
LFNRIFTLSELKRIDLGLSQKLQQKWLRLNAGFMKWKIPTMDGRLVELGNAAFIGEYWSSYLLCIVAPERTRCTPHDQNFARCWRCVQAVLAAPVIYLVDRDWLDSFPEEIEQFGQRLKKQGLARNIAGYQMAPYHNIAPSTN